MNTKVLQKRVGASVVAESYVGQSLLPPSREVAATFVDGEVINGE